LYFLLLAKWFSGAMLAWPIVFVSILLIAPRLQSFVKTLLKTDFHRRAPNQYEER